MRSMYIVPFTLELRRTRVVVPSQEIIPNTITPLRPNLIVLLVHVFIKSFPSTPSYKCFTVRSEYIQLILITEENIAPLFICPQSMLIGKVQSQLLVIIATQRFLRWLSCKQTHVAQTSSHSLTRYIDVIRGI